MPKVSICVPTYQNPEEVKRLTESIARQTFTDYELIVTDDSKDNRIENYIKDLQALEGILAGKIRYYHNEKPLGHIFNWNKALSYAEGEYIKIMFSDDWFTYPDSLEKLVALLQEHKEADLAFCGSMQVSEKESYARAPQEKYVKALAEDYRQLFIGNEIGAPSDTLYRNDPGVRFDEKSNWASDVFLYFEILKKNPVFAFTPEPLISIGVHENQYTNSFSDKDQRIYGDYEYLYQKYQLDKSDACKKWFLEKYLIRQQKGLLKAKKNGYKAAEYLKAQAKYRIREVLPCYFRALIRKINVFGVKK